MGKIPVNEINYNKMFVKSVIITVLWCFLALSRDFIRFKLPVQKTDIAYVIIGDDVC